MSTAGICSHCGRTLPPTANTCDYCSDRYWWRREAILILVLLLIAAGMFAVTYILTRAFTRHQDALARHWSQVAETALAKGNPQQAVADFRSALLYARDNRNYRLRLAQALAAANHVDEAVAYFLTLWEQQPGDGVLNLELARLAARKQETEQAIRFFHGAIYGVWNDDPVGQRREARCQLISYLLSRGLTSQADTELIALWREADLANAEVQLEVGDLFTQAADHERALQAYQRAAQLIPNSPRALSAAGRAAFAVGQYGLAESYLRRVVTLQANQAEARELLDRARLVLAADPFQHRLRGPERDRRILQAFNQAGQRLRACATQKQIDLNAMPPANDVQRAYGQWSEVQPRISPSLLRDDPDLRDATMDLVGHIEELTAATCGPATGLDWALLAITRSGGRAQ